MPDVKKKKSILNKLLAVMLIVIAGLIALFFYLTHEENKRLDLTAAYGSDMYELSGYTTADTFASNIVISNENVSLDGFELTSGSERALLFNTDSKTSVFAHGIYQKAYPASLTKIMTAILAAKYGNMTDVVTMQAEDFALESGSQNSSLKAGDTVTMEQLYRLLLVYSANDAANAIARHIDGSSEAFVERMNNEAKSLGMTLTHFKNPHGLHDIEHYTCAYDVYLMLNEAMKYPMFTETIRMSSYTLSVQREDKTIAYHYDSTDGFLNGEYNVPDGVILWGGKTGTTPEAGANLALIAQDKQGIPYIAVIMNADKKVILYDDMTKLLDCINKA